MNRPLEMLPLHRTIRWLVAALGFAVLVPPGTQAAIGRRVAPAGASCGVWAIVPSPPSSTATAYLEGTGGSADNDVWAVGHHANYSGAGSHGIFRHWNGRAWAPVANPPNRGQFSAVAAISRTDAWAVGEGPMIAHWNGRQWSMVKSPRVTYDPREPALLLGVAALSANNVWAAGFNWHYRTLQLIEHWNGTRWSVVPGVPSGQHPLFGIAALSATDIWAVGHGMEHWNGRAWTLVPAPAAASAVAAVASDDVWAAGGAVIQHWDGATWRVVSVPESGEQYTVLTGIAAVSADDVWAVGYAGHIVPHDGYAEHPFVLHWDGSVWSAVSTPPTGSPDSQLLAVTSVAPRTIWAVGFAGKHREGVVHTLIERYLRC